MKKKLLGKQCQWKAKLVNLNDLKVSNLSRNNTNVNIDNNINQGINLLNEKKKKTNKQTTTS